MPKGNAEIKNVLGRSIPALKREKQRQRGRVVRAPDLKSIGRGFKSRSDC